jgi:hypothetical protein
MTAVNAMTEMRDNTNQIVLACDMASIKWTVYVFVEALVPSYFHIVFEVLVGRLLILEALRRELGEILIKLVFLTFFAPHSDVFSKFSTSL